MADLTEVLCAQRDGYIVLYHTVHPKCLSFPNLSGEKHNNLSCV